MNVDLVRRWRALELRRRFLAPLGEGPGDGWAYRAMSDSVRRPLLLALVVVHVVMALLAWADDQQRGHTGALVAAHLLVAGAALAARQTRLPAWPAVLLGDAVVLLDWWSTDSLDTPLYFAAAWTRNLSAALPTFLLPARGGLVVQLSTCLGIPVAMLLLRPDLDPAFPVAVGVTGLSIVVVTRVGMSFLTDLAAAADHETDVAEERRRNLAAQRAAHETALEDARVLHDTVINTLAAVAAGGGALQDLDLVRQRCARDVDTLESLRGRWADVEEEGDLRDLPPVIGIEVVHAGLQRGRLDRATSRLPAAAVRALRRSVAELVQNAAKHSGAPRVVVDIATDDTVLVLTVSDEGRGFDGQVVDGRGLDRSVLQRCGEAGVAVEVLTAPGRGTSVTLRAPLDPAAPLMDQEEWEEVSARTLRGVVRRAGLLYAAGLTAVGLVLAATNHHGAITTEYVMVLLNVLALAVVLTSTGTDRPGWRTAVLVLVPPLSFAMTALAVDLGRDQPVLWQAIGPTGPLVLLLGSSASRRPLVTSVLLYVAAAAGLALVVARDSLEAAVVVVLAAAVGLGLVGAWRSFMGTIEVIGREAAAARRRAELARVELAVRAEADRTRARWRAAGLDDALVLVRRIATGELDPREVEVRAACAAEESYLRQLTLLDPRLVRLGGALMPCLSQARAGEVTLSIRTGGEDVDERTARAWGELVREVTARATPGSVVVTSVFPGAGGTRLSLVTGADAVTGTDLDLLPSRATALDLGDQVLLEVVVPTPGAPSTAGVLTGR